jgi:hypothetical protein
VRQRPVAALWSHLPEVDKGLKKCPEAEIGFSGELPQFFDLMGADDYVEEFKKALFLPHTDIELFRPAAPAWRNGNG